MSYSVQITPKALDQLHKLPLSVQNRLKLIIDSLSHNPRPHGSKKLSGGTDLYSIRSGDYRVVYTIIKDELIILIVKIGKRDEIYRDILRIRF